MPAKVKEMKIKQIILTLVAFFLVCTATVSNAQTLSKSEKKSLKKEIKAYKKSPEKYAKMQDRTKTQIIELGDEVEELKAKLAAMTAEKQELEDKLETLELQNASLKKNGISAALPTGTVYQVQMGYYEYLDLVSFNAKLKTVKAEEIDGAKRYIIGYFENVMDAVQFSNDVKKLGVRDAFVTQYVDGQRNMNFDALKSLKR